jgi:glycosyltransferase involved in cell wall biosynthesis
MRVLVLHNRYRQPGGEDAVCHDEVHMLRSRGVDVIHHEVSNAAPEASALTQIRQAAESAWSNSAAEEVRAICRRSKPDVAHVHNFWMSLSPAIHGACQREGVATVQTLHNYRLFCVNALLLRDGRICEDCIGRSPWLGVARRCYRDSALASALVANMIDLNRRRGTWQKNVNAFIALSEFSKLKYVSGGLPKDRLWVKPNFVEDPGPQKSKPSQHREIVFVGRLSREKGLGVLLEAWADVAKNTPAILRIIGDGPQREALEKQASTLGLRNLEFCGHQTPSRVQSAMMNSRAVVMASVLYENFPRVIAEAFACGRPMVVADVGAQREIVASGRLGWNFESGNARSLASCLREMLDNHSLVDQFGDNARKEYLSRYGPEENFSRLMTIYQAAIRNYVTDHQELRTCLKK